MVDDGDAAEDEEDALDLDSEDDNFMQVVRTFSVFEPGVSATSANVTNRTISTPWQRF
jgi:hypothetical protein